MKKQTVSLLVLLLAASGFFFSCGNTVNKTHTRWSSTVYK